jgi:hypothetical protein
MRTKGTPPVPQHSAQESLEVLIRSAPLDDYMAAPMRCQTPAILARPLLLNVSMVCSFPFHLCQCPRNGFDSHALFAV